MTTNPIIARFFSWLIVPAFIYFIKGIAPFIQTIKVVWDSPIWFGGRLWGIFKILTDAFVERTVFSDILIMKSIPLFTTLEGKIARTFLLMEVLIACGLIYIFVFGINIPLIGVNFSVNSIVSKFVGINNIGTWIVSFLLLALAMGYYGVTHGLTGYVPFSGLWNFVKLIFSSPTAVLP